MKLLKPSHQADPPTTPLDLAAEILGDDLFPPGELMSFGVSRAVTVSAFGEVPLAAQHLQAVARWVWAVPRHPSLTVMLERMGNLVENSEVLLTFFNSKELRQKCPAYWQFIGKGRGHHEAVMFEQTAVQHGLRAGYADVGGYFSALCFLLLTGQPLPKEAKAIVTPRELPKYLTIGPTKDGKGIRFGATRSPKLWARTVSHPV